MDYHVTWLDHEMTVLGHNNFVDDDELELVGLTKQITAMLEENLVPEGTVQYTVDLYDQ